MIHSTTFLTCLAAVAEGWGPRFPGLGMLACACLSGEPGCKLQSPGCIRRSWLSKPTSNVSVRAASCICCGASRFSASAPLLWFVLSSVAFLARLLHPFRNSCQFCPACRFTGSAVHHMEPAIELIILKTSNKFIPLALSLRQTRSRLDGASDTAQLLQQGY